MTALTIALTVAFASGGVALVAASVAVRLLWPTVRRRLETVAPSTRAPLAAALRLGPAILAAGTSAVVLIAFAGLEPADTREVLGLTLRAMAIGSLAVVAPPLVRARRAWRATAATIAEWTVQRSEGPAPPSAGVPTFNGRDVLVFDRDYPVVAVAGIRKPRLCMARRVIESCNHDEIDAMIAHEAAHVAAADNLTRLLFLSAPMTGAGSRCVAEIESAWTMASEEAADDRARHDARSSLALASALIKIARMAIAVPAPVLHASAILSGNGIERRVRRLLASEPPRVRSRVSLLLFATFALAAAMALSPPALHHVYELAEYCVRNLP